MMTSTFFSPAKVNLYLQISGRRDDGYHLLESLMQTLTLCDRLSFTDSAAGKDSLSVTGIPVDSGPDNLVLRAADLFRRKSGISVFYSIHLQKNIPVEAGLGGGSSNAATTLFAMNTFAGSPFSEEELRAMGASLGADVSFFFSQGTALVGGIGEKLMPLAPLEMAQEAWVIKPPFGLSTKAVYGALDLSKLPLRTAETCRHAIEHGDYSSCFNDLEAAAMATDVKLADFKKRLEELFSTVLLCGSGSAFFCHGALGGVVDTVIAKELSSSSSSVRFANRQRGCWYSAEEPL